MYYARWITIAWPGLTQLWLTGAWWGLALGIAFAWLVNLALVSTFVWTELIDIWSRAGVWGLAAVVWALSAKLSVAQIRRFDPNVSGNDAEDLFRRAGREYLSGNWIAAEQLLTQLVRSNPKDVDAQLMLASLLRRTGQLTEASQRLRRLEATDGAEKWKAEIKRERQLLDEQFHPAAAEEQEVTAADTESANNEEEPPANQAA
ncbi:MAG: tetratricopeptide repeat protein [Pirellulales bacterium]|nr:tetratricopeptide repeat protein [Pirellulales bacterium]